MGETKTNMGKVVLAALLLCLAVSAHGGAVRRDPVTGKWVEASNLPEHTDRRAGGDGGDFFAGFGFVDNRRSSGNAPSEASLSPDAPQVVATTDILTLDRPRRSSKYTQDLPVAENIQTQATAIEQEDNTLIQTSSSPQVERVFHKFDAVAQIQLQQAGIVRVRTIGNVCRFQGIAPASGCPVEAKNGCVDHIPCKLTCPSTGYFRWRCLGPQVVSPSDVASLPAPEQPVVFQPKTSTDEYVHDLAAKIGNAIQNNDYTGLARAILQAQSAPGTSAAAKAHLAFAVSQLSQMQQTSQPVADESLTPTL
eukprot:c5437_g1_i1.p1 GENE.c5437_g1_i1~~c5437_g1_i1.p1  ORF type:complete len:308 (+),score=64.99 c5437_g1_i1:1-924(+)